MVQRGITPSVNRTAFDLIIFKDSFLNYYNLGLISAVWARILSSENIVLTKVIVEMWKNGDIAATKTDGTGNIIQGVANDSSLQKKTLKS